MRRAAAGVFLAGAVLVGGPACGGGGDGGGGDAASTTAPPSTTPATQPRWTPMTFADARFRVAFPREPIRAQDDIETVSGDKRKVIIYSLNVAVGEYSVVWADLEGAQVDPPALLAEVQQDVLNEVKGTIESSTDLAHKTHPAKELVAKMADGGYLKARIIVTPRDLFVVQATGPTPEPTRYAEFVTSFEVL